MNKTSLHHKIAVEGALFKQELMLTFYPSVIAMAAVLRAEETLVESKNLHSNMTENLTTIYYNENSN